MATMNNMPPEMVCRIFSYLENLDLKSVRQVNPIFHAVASHHLFSRILIAPRKDVLSAFRRIYEHPTYRMYVKEIVYDGSMYDVRVHTPVEVYAKHILSTKNDETLSWLLNTSLKLSSPSILLAAYAAPGYERYREAFEEQQDIRDEGDDYRALTQGLKVMPRVRCLVYSNHLHHHLPAESITRDIGTVTRCVSSIGKGEKDLWQEFSRDYGIFSMLHALAAVKKHNVREVRVKGDHGRGLPPNFFCRDIQEIRLAGAAFRHLRIIRLTIAHPVADGIDNNLWNSYDEYLNGRTLGSFLEQAYGLERLTLLFCYTRSGFRQGISQNCDDDSPMLPIFLGRVTWPNLRKLTLGGLAAHEDELADLLQRHDSTLEHVRLDHCALSAGLWANVAKTLAFNHNTRKFGIFGCRDYLNEDGKPYAAPIRLNNIPYPVRESDRLPRYPCNPEDLTHVRQGEWRPTFRPKDGFWMGPDTLCKRAALKRIVDLRRLAVFQRTMYRHGVTPKTVKDLGPPV